MDPHRKLETPAPLGTHGNIFILLPLNAGAPPNQQIQMSPTEIPMAKPPILLSKYLLFYKTMDLLAHRAPDDAKLAASDKSRPFCQFLKLMDSVPIFQVEVLQEQTSGKIYIVL